MFAGVVLTLPVLALLIRSVLHVSVQPLLLPSHHDGHADRVMLMVVIGLPPPLPRPLRCTAPGLCVCVVMCVCVCVLSQPCC